MSSTEPVEEALAAAPKPEPTEQPPMAKKSYRRKYRKIMVTFEENMRESNALFKEEQRLADISQRLAEQTDQLLELLVELNSHPQIPPRLRYDLKVEGESDPTEQPPRPPILEADADLELHKARAQIRNGDMTLSEYRAIQTNILKSPEFVPGKSYASLLSLVAPFPPATDNPDLAAAVPSGYLSVKYEEQYIHSLDLFLDSQIPMPRPHATNSLGSRMVDKNADREREREYQLRNPVSVYNWLRKHQPQVFLQDNEAGHSTEKTPRATGSRSSARKSTQKESIKLEKDYDDEGIAADGAGPSAKGGKRKRDDDGGYRPKGGSSRSAKRRRETKDDVTKGKRSKKPSIDVR